MPTVFNHEVVVIGAPSGAGANHRGCEAGPAAWRAAGLLPALQAQGWRVRDAGDLKVPPGSEISNGPGPYRHLAEVTAWARAVYAAVAQVLAQGAMPLLLGGDHSLAIGSLSAVAQHCRLQGRRLRVLWFDAHADCNTADTSPSGNLHGMPVACLRGLGPRVLTHLGGSSPALAADALQLLGVRSLDPGEAALVQQLEVQRVDQAALQVQGMDAILAQVLQDLGPQTHLHLSLDVDVLDPALAPGVSTPVPDGLTLTQALRCMDRMAASGRLASLDLVEFNPAADVAQRTARCGVALLTRLFDRSGEQA